MTPRAGFGTWHETCLLTAFPGSFTSCCFSIGLFPETPSFWSRPVRGAGLPGLRHGVRLSRGAWELEGEVAGPGAVARKPGPGGMSQAPRAPPKAERGARRPVPLTVRGTDRRRGRAIPCQRCSSLPPTLIFNLFGKFQTYQLCEEET